MPTRAPAITVAGYSHVAIMVDDLDAALAFYCDVARLLRAPPPRLRTRHRGRVAAARHRAGAPRRRSSEMGARVRLPAPRAAHPRPTPGTTPWPASRRAASSSCCPRASALDFGKPVRAAFIRDPAGNVIELTDVDPT